MMNAKRSIKILISIYSSLAAVLVVFLGILIYSGNLSKRTAGILLPDDGNFVEAWNDQLPKFASRLEIPEMTIYTYSNADELKSYLSQCEKFNILWAEIPICGEYNLKEILKTYDVTSIERKYAQFYPASLFNAILEISGQKEMKFLPLSYNPWIMVKRKSVPTKSPFRYSLGAQSESNALAFITYMRMDEAKTKQIRTTDEALDQIQKMSSNKVLINNSNTYSEKDAFIALENGTSSECLMSTSFFSSLSISQRENLKFDSMEQTLICDATVAIFPVRKSEENKERVEKAKNLLITSPNLVFPTANDRGWMPAIINTSTRSIYTENLRSQARLTSKCYIPGMEYSSEEEKAVLSEKMDRAFRAIYAD